VASKLMHETAKQCQIKYGFCTSVDKKQNNIVTLHYGAKLPE